MVNDNTIKEPSLLHLFRPLNLTIIALTMYLLRWFLLKPLLGLTSKLIEFEVTSQISEGWFAVLVLSVLFIAAGGNIINDYKDVAVDKLNNRPNPVGKLISPEKTYQLYQITTVIGLILGFAIAFHIGNYNYGIIQLTAAISLWFYSYYFKRSLLIGNVVVAFVVGLVPMTVGIYEVTLLQIKYFQKVTNYVDFNFNYIAYWFMAYSVFAFLMTLVREILKDVEDLVGDQQVGAKTLPIQWGKNTALAIASALNFVIIGSLIYARKMFLTDQISLVFIVITITLILWTTIVMWKDTKIALSPSNWNKLTALVGVIYLVALGYIIENELFFNA